MADVIISAVARDVEDLATYAEGLRSAASPSSPACSAAPAAPSGGAGNMREAFDILRWRLVRIRAMLDDAEETEAIDRSVVLRLRELDGVALAAQDALDELAPLLEEPPRLPLMLKNVGGFPPGVQMEGIADLLAQRIEAISLGFYEIMRHMEALRLRDFPGHGRVETPVQEPTSSMITEPYILGREEDLEAIKKFLLDAETRGTSRTTAIAIVGMGGIGKTTLAQLAYNDEFVTKHFDKKLWVYVSENFDLVRLTKAVIESSTQKPCHLMELESLHATLKQELGGQRFLLVLDDVWEVQNLSSCWNRFTAPLHHGSEGSKIIITTRNEKVSKLTRASFTYELSCIRDDHCMELFRRWAFEGQDPNSPQALLAIGEKISKKCRGLPLAAKTLAGLLSNEENEQEWNRILQCDIWETDEENSIMSILALSYQHLPGHLKRCFRFCSVFPKGYGFDKDRLVRMWIAQGYVQGKGRRQMEDIGKEYFDGLLQRSFFQHSQNPGTFMMHDLIHELSRSVSRNDCCTVEDGESCSIQGDVQHMSIVLCSDPLSLSLPRPIWNTRALRSLLFTHHSFRWNYTMKPFNDLFSQLKYLRLLDLSYIDLEDLPSSIGCLRHLRYLGLRSNRLRQLPESVGSLYHLQTLDLESSGIQFLPNSISNLLNLRHIISEHRFEYPMGIGKLTNLQTMAGFHMSPRLRYAKLGELKDINNIQSLRISGIHNLTDVNEAKKASLVKKERLRRLDLSWDQWHLPSISDEVLEGLKPSPNIEWLNIFYFRGHFLPSWLEHPSFSRLATVKLIGCEYWTSLPPLGQLPSLKFLSISGARRVEHIDCEFFSGGFQRLETLEMGGMDSWKWWCGAQEGQCRQLRRLSIHKCEHLTSLSLNNFDALQDLEIRGCEELQLTSDFLPQVWQLPSLQKILVSRMCKMRHIEGVLSRGGIQSLETSWLKLDNCDELEAWSIVAQEKCSSICQLTVSGCETLTSLPFSNLSSLRCLEIERCYQLQFSREDRLPPTLKVLGIHGCDNLQYLPLGNLNSLERLRIRHCAQLHLLEQDQLPPTIKDLGVIGCDSLDFLRLGNLSSLQKLSISCCARLQFSNEDQLPPTLKDLGIYGCDNLHFLSLGNLNSLESLSISNCSPLNFSSVDLPPPALEDLSINGCPFLIHWCQHHRQRLLQIPCLEIEGIDGHIWFQTEATEAYLQRIITLELVWDCHTGHRSFKGEPEDALNTLVIPGTMGLRYATWLGDPSFSNVVSLTLHCSHCELLPSLGKLPILTELYISGAHMLRCITTICGNNGREAFPSLTKLELRDMPSLEEWEEIQGSYLPSLRELILRNCPLLKALPRLPPFLEELEVENCDVITFVGSFDGPLSLCTLKISRVPVLESLSCLHLRLRKLVLRRLPALANFDPPPSVQELVLQDCSEAVMAKSILRLTSLTSLHVSDFPMLTTIPLGNPRILEELHISNCPELAVIFYLWDTTSWQALRSLKHLSISDCPKLRFFANDRPQSALQSVDIANCPLAQKWHDKHWRNRRGQGDEGETLSIYALPEPCSPTSGSVAQRRSPKRDRDM